MANAINRWEPGTGLSLRDAINQLFEDSWVRPLSTWSGSRSSRYLPLDIYESAESFFVKAFLPGVLPENLDITVQNNTLTIRAEQPAEQQEGVRYYLRERTGGTWFRSFELPVPVDADHIDARLEHGVLHLTLPKVPEAKPHKVDIRTA